MIQSPVLRAVLVVALLAFAAFCFWMPSEPGYNPLLPIVLGLLALTFAVGLVFPDRRRIALRIVASAVALFYLIYFGGELVALLRGEPQVLRVGQPSAAMAGLGLLVWGVPLLIYAFSGRTLGEHRMHEAIRNDPSGELADRIGLDELAGSGVDMDAVTTIRFYLQFPSIEHARSAESVAQREGLFAEVLQPDSPNGLAFCRVTQESVPSWENIRAARSRFEQLASTLGGTFEGWEAAIDQA